MFMGGIRLWGSQGTKNSEIQKHKQNTGIRGDAVVQQARLQKGETGGDGA